MPNRLNIILTSKTVFRTPSTVVFSNFEKALNYAKQPESIEKYGSEIFIEGGGEIYKQTLLDIK